MSDDDRTNAGEATFTTFDLHYLDDDGALPHSQGVVGAQQVGRYELLLELAHGGMATVCIGRQRGAGGFERLVAIKRMHPHISANDELAKSFMDEARIASLIRHPNVVSVHDVYESEEEGERLLVMDYIEGVSLAGLMKAARKQKVKIPRPAAVRIIIDALNGLHAAHELKNMDGRPMAVVHRDATPHNLLIGVDGSVRLTDFGIAKAAERSTHTQDGVAKGKFRYMAPEQARGKSLDRRVDIFAMGVVAWEVFTSQRLFKGGTDVEILMEVSEGRIEPMKKAAPDAPEALEKIVMRALSYGPNDRWATAQAFSDALEQWAREAGELTTSSEVARLVDQLCGEQVRQRQTELKDVLHGRRLPAGQKPKARGATAGTGSASGTSAPLTVDSVKVVAAVSEEDLKRARTKRQLSLIAILLGVFALVGVGALLTSAITDSGAQPEAPAGAATTASEHAPTSEPAPSLPAKVEIEIVANVGVTGVEAPGAVDVKIDRDTATFALPRSDESVMVEVHLADGSKMTEVVTPKRSMTIHLRVGQGVEKVEPVATPTSAKATSPPGPKTVVKPDPKPTKPSDLESNPYE